MNRKSIKAQVRESGIEKAMRVPKGTLTPKMRRFAEQVALGESGAQAYRLVYSDKAKPKTAGDNASRLKADIRIQAEVERIERAQQLAALHSAAGLRSIVISTLAEIATNPESKDAVRVQAVRSIGNLVGVDAFRETKRVEHVQDSGAIKAQILDQLKSMVLNTGEAETVDAESLLSEIAGDEPHHAPTTPNAERDSDSHEHTIPLKRSPSFSDADPSESPASEHPPSSLEIQDGEGDIFGENQ